MVAKKSVEPPLPVSPPPAGLCGDCLHRRLQRGGRSLFVRCALANSDPAYPRYPRLPVIACQGYRPE